MRDVVLGSMVGSNGGVGARGIPAAGRDVGGGVMASFDVLGARRETSSCRAFRGSPVRAVRVGWTFLRGPCPEGGGLWLDEWEAMEDPFDSLEGVVTLRRLDGG